jgi:hypothetical protein
MIIFTQCYNYVTKLPEIMAHSGQMCCQMFQHLSGIGCWDRCANTWLHTAVQ